MSRDVKVSLIFAGLAAASVFVMAPAGVSDEDKAKAAAISAAVQGGLALLVLKIVR